MWIQFKKVAVRLLVAVTAIMFVSCSSNNYVPIATYEPDTTSLRDAGEPLTYEPNEEALEESP